MHPLGALIAGGKERREAAVDALAERREARGEVSLTSA
jgi:hypothetical protein